MKLIVGLGNPGADYARTRHNIGWRTADAFAKKFRIDVDRHEKDAMTGEGRVAGGTVKVAKPLTYMNNSGDVVRLLVNARTECCRSRVRRLVAGVLGRTGLSRRAAARAEDRSDHGAGELRERRLGRSTGVRLEVARELRPGRLARADDERREEHGTAVRHSRADPIRARTQFAAADSATEPDVIRAPVADDDESADHSTRG